jgi:hypothetical protein
MKDIPPLADGHIEFIMTNLLLLTMTLCVATAGHAGPAVKRGAPVKRAPARRDVPSLFVSKPDMALKIPAVNWHDAHYSIQISRQFHGAREERLLRKAEAVYPAKAKVLADSEKSFVRILESDRKAKALWWCGRFDGVRLPYAVTAASALYYYNTIQQFRRGNFGAANGIQMNSAHLSYAASIKHQELIVVDKKAFGNVYVATLRLSWSHSCGSMCGMSFDRTRTVVLDPSGRIAVEGDGIKKVSVN